VIEQYNILDFETTGFSADYDRIIEVGVVKIRNNKIVGTFQEFVNPGQRISSTITNLTGISNEMVKGAQRSSAVMKQLKSFVGDELIVAHNASFDSRFFFAEMERAGFEPTNKFLCSLLLSRRIFQELDSHKLGYLCRHLGYVNKASHRAFEDAEVTYKVFGSICDRVKQMSDKDELSAEFLTRLSKVPKKKVAQWLQEY
jgi:DNA polymerase-3 subunit epsilon